MKANIIFSLLITSLHVVTIAATDDVAVTAKKEGCSEFYDAIVAAGVYEHAKKQPDENGSLAPFTVFAPANEAFAAIKDIDPKKKKQIITLHVVPGKKIAKTADDMKDGVPTVGEQLLFEKEGKISLDRAQTKATITKGPIDANNGVVYLIDTVLLPAGETVKKPEQKSEHTQEQKAEPKPEHTVETKIEPKAQTKAVAPIITEHTAQALITSVTQLTQSIQLLIHVIQQAQAASEAPATAASIK
ncbi:MAG: hypothetical protein QG632_624 [Candidatus Dependentiae bacterium]|nr:hypothetical protein [Candidatus Dependentiae bacterium]